MSDELQRIEEEWATAVAESDVEAAREILADDFVLTSSGGVSEHMPLDEWLAALPGLDNARWNARTSSLASWATWPSSGPGSGGRRRWATGT